MLPTAVMCVQLPVQIFDSVEAYRGAMARYAQMAYTNEAKILVFPAHTGLLLAPALMEGMRATLARTTGKPAAGRPSFGERARGVLARPAAGLLRAKLPSALRAWLSGPAHLRELESRYRDIFSGLATQYRLYIVAGTYLRADRSGDEVFHSAAVFSSNGEQIGLQDQLHALYPLPAVSAYGEHLTPVETPLGTLGILIGEDILFPEPARVLAYRGVDIVVHLAAAEGTDRAQSLRGAFLSRIAENELLGVQSFIVGAVPWDEDFPSRQFEGRSAIAGPYPLVRRPGGIAAEMGGSVEGALQAAFDLHELHAWWQDGPTSLRRAMRPGLYHTLLTPFYSRGQSIHDVRAAGAERPAVPSERRPAPAAQMPPSPPTPEPEPAEESREEREVSAGDQNLSVDVEHLIQDLGDTEVRIPEDEELKDVDEDRARFWD